MYGYGKVPKNLFSGVESPAHPPVVNAEFRESHGASPSGKRQE